MKMSLKQKGALRPPPILAEPFERVSQAIQGWPGIVAATHWHLSRNRQVDGADFYLALEEMGHLHLDGEVHLATNLELSVPLVKAGLARRFTYGGDYAGWVEMSIRTEADAEHAIWLFRLNYDRLCGQAASDLIHRDSVARGRVPSLAGEARRSPEAVSRPPRSTTVRKNRLSPDAQSRHAAPASEPSPSVSYRGGGLVAWRRWSVRPG